MHDETEQERLDRASAIYREHDCAACHTGGATAILHHLDSVRMGACKLADVSILYADRLSKRLNRKVF